MKDGDYSVPQEWREGLICESCAAEQSCEACGELAESLHHGMHRSCYNELRDEKRQDERRGR
jgi:hypothetical protein